MQQRSGPGRPAAVGGRLQMWSCTSGRECWPGRGESQEVRGELRPTGASIPPPSIRPAPEHPCIPPRASVLPWNTPHPTSDPPSHPGASVPPCPWFLPLSPRGSLGVFLRPNPEVWVTPRSPQGPSLALGGAVPSYASAGAGQGHPPPWGHPAGGLSPCPRRGPSSVGLGRGSCSPTRPHPSKNPWERVGGAMLSLHPCRGSVPVPAHTGGTRWPGTAAREGEGWDTGAGDPALFQRDRGGRGTPEPTVLRNRPVPAAAAPAHGTCPSPRTPGLGGTGAQDRVACWGAGAGVQDRDVGWGAGWGVQFGMWVGVHAGVQAGCAG